MEATDAGWGYCIRVNAYDGYLEKARMMVMAYNWVAGMAHKGERKDPNPHYHFVIKTNLEDGTIRKRFKSIFDKGKGNAHMSIKKWDGNMDAVAYLFHEDPDADLTFRRGVTDEYITDARNRNKRVLVEVGKAKGKASWTLEEDVMAQLISAERTTAGSREIAKMIYLTALRNGKYAPNDYLCKAMVTKILFRLCDGDVVEEAEMAERMADRLYRWDGPG